MTLRLHFVSLDFWNPHLPLAWSLYCACLICLFAYWWYNGRRVSFHFCSADWWALCPGLPKQHPEKERLYFISFAFHLLFNSAIVGNLLFKLSSMNVQVGYAAMCKHFKPGLQNHSWQRLCCPFFSLVYFWSRFSDILLGISLRHQWCDVWRKWAWEQGLYWSYFFIGACGMCFTRVQYDEGWASKKTVIRNLVQS